jgi:1-aminocyclopropane-1-carboxylate deaminase/D-cysteine desulfhydrase-like pyridoxal-dependent ACC family enzyme
LVDFETVVNLISNTTTTAGLKVSCKLDRRQYPIGRKVTEKEWETVKVIRDNFHGDWNYTIRPRR